MSLQNAIGGIGSGVGEALAFLAKESRARELLDQESKQKKRLFDQDAENKRREEVLRYFLANLSARDLSPEQFAEAGAEAAKPGRLEGMGQDIRALSAAEQQAQAPILAPTGALPPPSLTSLLGGTMDVEKTRRLRDIVASKMRPKSYAPPHPREVTWANVQVAARTWVQNDPFLNSMRDQLMGYTEQGSPERVSFEKKMQEVERKLLTEKFMELGRAVVKRIPSIPEMRAQLGGSFDVNAYLANKDAMGPDPYSVLGNPGKPGPSLGVAPSPGGTGLSGSGSRKLNGYSSE